MAKCITFHSYKGGTGKTTIAANLAATLARKGYCVTLLDLDIYGPSFSSYFDCYNPKNWINDLDLDEGAFGMETMEDTVASVGSGTLITYPDGTTCDPAFTFCPNILYPDGTTCDPNTTSCVPPQNIIADGGFSSSASGFNTENTSVLESEGGFSDEPASDLDVGTDAAAFAQESSSQLTLTCDPNSDTLSNGAQGPLVGNLQSILLALGYPLPNFGADNDFGTETENAVLLFQNEHPALVNDGVVGPITWSKLCEVYTAEVLGADAGDGPSPSSLPEVVPSVDPQPSAICSKPQSTNLGEFIQNSEASTLDYLEYDKCVLFRTTEWSHNDFPGNGGPNSGLARDIRKSLSDPQIFPERRANTNTFPGGTDNTALYLGRDIENENDPDWQYIISQLSSIPGGKKLNKYAANSFNQMQAAALSDGVELNIASAWRPLSSTRGGECTNPAAKACGSTALSSHNMGLAGDFRLPAYGIKTRPFQDVIDMRQTPEHKWLMVNGPDYGWYPYNNEPWHFEYNPPGFRETFFAEK